MLPNRPGDLEPIDPTAALELLGTVPVSRIAFVHAGRPTIRPINHVLHDGALYFRSAAGSTLGAAASDAPVAVEADDSDPERQGGWSVIVEGHARIVTDEALLEQLHALPYEPWADPDGRSFWVQVHLEGVSGRRVRPRAS